MNSGKKPSARAKKAPPVDPRIDTLTGVLNRSAMEAEVNQLSARGGMFFLGDLVRFGEINDLYGHPAGDRLLQKAVELLRYMIRRTDLIARVGGDEFALFVESPKSEARVLDLCERIENRFVSFCESNPEEITLHITMAGTVAMPGETFEELYARTSAQLEERRAALAAEQEETEEEPELPQDQDEWQRDSERIHDDLVEEISTGGAFCQDYATFRSIYRFLERCIIRNNQQACVILLSMVDEAYHSLAPAEKERLMVELGDILQHSLRMGDVYTRYSSCQYLVLVIDTNEHFADMIAERIKNSFVKSNPERNILVHYCYQLSPAKVQPWEK